MSARGITVHRVSRDSRVASRNGPCHRDNSKASAKATASSLVVGFFLSRIICCVEVPCRSIVAYRVVSSVYSVRFACLFGPLCHSH